MLRITVMEGANQDGRWVRLVVEGKVAGEWVQELESAWRGAAARPANRLEVDLKGVELVSAEGKALLCAMRRAGVQLRNGGLWTRCVVDGLRPSVALVAIALLMVAGTARAQEPGTPLRLSLRDAVNLSLKQNPQVILAGIDVDDSRQDQKLVRSALLPQLGASASDTIRRGNIETNFGRALPGFPHHLGPFYIVNAGVTGSAPLFDLTLWRRLQSSRASVEASRAGATTVREQATLLVVSQYLGAQRATADVQAAQSRVDLAQALYDQAADLQSHGVGTRIDTLRADVERKAETQRLIQSKTERATALYGLARLLGLEATVPIELADELEFFDTPEFVADQSLQAAYETRPEMARIRARRTAAALDRKAAGAARLPRLRFDGGWSQQGLTPARMVPAYQYAATVELPLFTGGRIEARETKADLELKRLAQQEADLRNRISVEVNSAVAQLNSARSEVEVANAAAGLAQEEVTQARDRFQAGVANNIEVITAQDALSRASDNRIAALYRFNQSRADLAHAAGRIESMFSR